MNYCGFCSYICGALSLSEALEELYCQCYHRLFWKSEQLYWSQHTFCYLGENIANTQSNKMLGQ